ncbi:unnamed protein product, partial [Staurois parvus]
HPACASSLGARSTAILENTVEHQLSYGTSLRGPDHVITDWPMTSLLTT